VSILITLIAFLLILWPAINNFSGGYLSVGIIFTLAALIPHCNIFFLLFAILPAKIWISERSLAGIPEKVGTSANFKECRKAG